MFTHDTALNENTCLPFHLMCSSSRTSLHLKKTTKYEVYFLLENYCVNLFQRTADSTPNFFQMIEKKSSAVCRTYAHPVAAEVFRRPRRPHECESHLNELLRPRQEFIPHGINCYGDEDLVLIYLSCRWATRRTRLKKSQQPGNGDKKVRGMSCLLQNGWWQSQPHDLVLIEESC